MDNVDQTQLSFKRERIYDNDELMLHDTDEFLFDELIEDKATQTEANRMKRKKKTSGSIAKRRKLDPKWLKPRNATEILNELTTIDKEYTVIADKNKVHCELRINNVHYKSEGSKASIAKNDVSEKALRDLMMPKIDGTANYASDIGMEDVIDRSPSMRQIASLALYKLYKEWKLPTHDIKQEIPQLHNDSLPKFGSIHPASLLNMLCPQHRYYYQGCRGQQPNQIYEYRVEVDNEQFFGQGQSKKMARKECAIKALNYVSEHNVK